MISRSNPAVMNSYGVGVPNMDKILLQNVASFSITTMSGWWCSQKQTSSLLQPVVAITCICSIDSNVFSRPFLVMVCTSAMMTVIGFTGMIGQFGKGNNGWGWGRIVWAIKQLSRRNYEGSTFFTPYVKHDQTFMNACAISDAELNVLADN